MNWLVYDLVKRKKFEEQNEHPSNNKNVCITDMFQDLDIIINNF